MSVKVTDYTADESKSWRLLREQDDKVRVGFILGSTPGELSFLKPDQIRQLRSYCQLDENLEPQLLTLSEKIANNADLRQFASDVFHALINNSTETEKKLKSVKLVSDDEKGLLNLLLGLGLVPLIQEACRQHNVPESVIRDTCFQIKCYCGNHRLGNHGKPGIITSQLAWLPHYLSGKFLRVGRLEFELTPWKGKVEVYRHTESKESIAFLADGTHINHQGLIAFLDEKNQTTCRLKNDGDSITGFQVLPNGFAELKPVTISLKKWKPVLTKGDWVLNMHIPAGEKMSMSLCRRSMLDAAVLFERLFYETAIYAIACESWIFNPQLEHLLPGSNMVKFMRETYMFPIESSGVDGLFFIYCREYDDWKKAPRKTSLQKVLLGVLDRGEKLRNGGMFILKEDLKHFGTQFYRNPLYKHKYITGRDIFPLSKRD